ncbi:MAG: ADP-ribosylglycohydrolase family protein [Opitutaceae bacterium]|jgi:ADP-ribosylglycohydrolase
MTRPSSEDRLTFQERCEGALYGSLVGDALGVPVEFSSREQRDSDPVSDMRAYGTWNQPAGTWSDDGALLLCTAETLIDGTDIERTGASFVRWMKNGEWAAHGKIFDIGGTTQAALSRIDAGCPASLAGGVDVESNGNGSLMRILPVALRFHSASPDTVSSIAMQFSAITHAHIRSQLACSFYCLFAQSLLAGETVPLAYEKALTSFRPIIAVYPGEQTHFERLLSGRLPEEPRTAIRSSGYVLDTLEASIWCLHHHKNFASTVLTAVNLAEDTDTTGCVTGGLAGIHYGVSAIPSDWRNILPRQNDLKALFSGFLNECHSSGKP